jgi:hypothetical protein
VIEFLSVQHHAQLKMKPNDSSKARIPTTGGAGFTGSAPIWMLNRFNNESI